LESFIEEKLLLHRAEQNNVQPNEKAFRAMMERISPESTGGQEGRTDPARRAELERSVKESLMMQEYLNDYLIKGVAISDEECEAYYKAHLEEYVKNDLVRVREILVDDLSLAEKIRGMLKAKANKNFEDLARVYSKAPSAADGGDLGLFERGDLPEEFEKAVFQLSPGSISTIVRTRYGYHIFLVEEKILAHQQRLIEVKDQIKEKLRLEREREIIDRELESLRKEIPVEIHRELLGFNYLGSRYGSPEGTVR
jgi:parvulin-like peptidyl-prolyl isomerase